MNTNTSKSFVFGIYFSRFGGIREGIFYVRMLTRFNLRRTMYTFREWAQKGEEVVLFLGFLMCREVS